MCFITIAYTPRKLQNSLARSKVKVAKSCESSAAYALVPQDQGTLTPVFLRYWA